MPVYIHPIETIVPDNFYKQEFTRDLLKQSLNGNDKMERVHQRVYAQSGIEKRHSVVPDFNLNGEAPLFWDQHGSILDEQPGTERRNRHYIKHARKMFSEVSRKALDSSPFEPSDVTHVITVSCTGFFAPGPEYFVVKDLGLRSSTQRFHLGFMGCFGAFPALRMAESICNADPEAVVLISVVELCTLHMQPREDMDGILSNSVFADGGAGVVLSSAKKGALQIKGLMSDLTDEGEEDMAWELSDQGFNMVLSSYVPKIIEAQIKDTLVQQLADHQTQIEEINHWAIHPGGRSILDKIEKSLEFSDDQLASSRKILREYGNMSSATVLFVMKEISENQITPGETMMAMAFGPGLTIESGLFQSCDDQIQS